MKKTMKALVKKYAKEGLWIDDVPVPEIGINDVLIKIHKTAICGTDVHIWNWDEWSQKTIPVPMTIGHEFVGEVVAMGSNVHDVKIGEISNPDLSIDSIIYQVSYISRP
jgi:threonine 3-dehydrogenase